MLENNMQGTFCMEMEGHRRQVITFLPFFYVCLFSGLVYIGYWE